MSDAVQVAVVTQFGLILVGIITIIGRQIHDRNTATQHHSSNTDKLESIKNEVDALKKELPTGGISTWIEVSKGHTEALKQQANATSALAATVSELKETVLRHGNILEKLTGGTA